MAHSMWANYESIAHLLDEIQDLMHRSVNVKNKEVATKIKEYIMASGKMLRPALMIYFSQLRQQENSIQVLYAAAATELFHIATLLHDDVIDGAKQRRGLEAFHITTSNRTAIYAGDYLITLSALLFHKAHYDIEVLTQRANSMHQILAGELFQHENLYRLEMSITDYLKQIKGKTAKLFALSAFLGRFESDSYHLHQAKQAFLVGQEFGMAFQIMDDLLDYTLEPSQTGKPRMQDVKNGIYTAPVLFALQSDRQRIDWMLRSQEPWTYQREQELYVAIDELGGFVKTKQLAKRFHVKAVERLNKMAGSTRDKREIGTLFETVLHRDF